MKGTQKMATEAKTPRRTCRLTRDGDQVILQVTEVKGRKTTRDFYRVEVNPNAPKCYRLHKLVHSDESPVVYDVDLRGKTCDCAWGTYREGREGGEEVPKFCRHIDGLLTLTEAGKL